MLRRFAPHIIIVSLVFASISVFLMQKITSNSYVDPQAARSCAELLSLYSAPYRPRLSRALSTTMSMCDYSVQFYDAEEALVRRVEAPDSPCVRLHEALDRLKGRHGLALLDRIASCQTAAVDPGVKGDSPVLKVEARLGSQTPISEVQPCEEVQASLVQDVPSERAFQAFKANPTKKNHCDFLIEVSNTERAIIGRFESASLHCRVLDQLNTQHAKTLETQTKVCEAAAVDADGL
jgi:hypothetical protein